MCGDVRHSLTYDKNDFQNNSRSSRDQADKWRHRTGAPVWFKLAELRKV
jgi:hypothetical protein